MVSKAFSLQIYPQIFVLWQLLEFFDKKCMFYVIGKRSDREKLNTVSDSVTQKQLKKVDPVKKINFVCTSVIDEKNRLYKLFPNQDLNSFTPNVIQVVEVAPSSQLQGNVNTLTCFRFKADGTLFCLSLVYT